MSVNLHAPLQIYRLLYVRMRRWTGGEGGFIINVLSIHSTQSLEYMIVYAASNSALDLLMRGMSLEYTPDGVRVNAVAPGVFHVERME